MIVAVPSSGNTMDSIVSERFARCAWFYFYNSDTGQEEFIQNTLKDIPEGAGPQVVEFLADRKVNSIYATEVGPKAENLLKRLNINIILIEEQETIDKIRCYAIEKAK